MFIQVAGYFASTIVHKIVEKSTLWKYGEVSVHSFAVSFPRCASHQDLNDKDSP